MILSNLSMSDLATQIENLENRNTVEDKYLFWLDSQDASSVITRTDTGGNARVVKWISKVNSYNFLSKPIDAKGTAKFGVLPYYGKSGTGINGIPTISVTAVNGSSYSAPSLDSLEELRHAGRFDPSDELHYNNPLGHFDHTIFCVMRSNNANVKQVVTTDASIFSIGNGIGLGSYQLCCGTHWGFTGQLKIEGNTNNPYVTGGNAANIQDVFKHNYLLENAGYSANKSLIIELTYEAINETINQVNYVAKINGYYNGNKSSYSFQNKYGLVDFKTDRSIGPCSQFRIFTNRNASKSFNSEIGELIFMKSIDSSDRNYVREYLSTKWGISIV